MILAYLCAEEHCVARQHLAECKHMELDIAVVPLIPDSVSKIKGPSMS